MLFSSIGFIFYFLPVFLVGYYLSGWRTGVLLAGSVAFYVWGEGVYIFLLAALIGLNHAGARLMAKASGRRADLILAALAATDLGVLAVFKYAGFLVHNLNAAWPGPALPEPQLALPLGISFFTFQLISYLIDVRRGATPVERDLTRFSTYILMFPHLIAGPIVRYADIRAEMHADRRQTAHVGLGVQYFIVGLCQKVLVANSVAPLADHAFGLDGPRLDILTAWTGLAAYTLQIYFDFCGYSNMAIGLAFLLGFTFPKNFDYPYSAQSITDFWRRWHMSLSSWFRDYVYIPLGGNRGGRVRTLRNLLIVFLLTGVWHGAAWQFVVWGLFHGGFLLVERIGLGRVIAAAPRLLRHVYALLVVMAGWVFFRAEDLPHALAYLAALVDPAGLRAPDIQLIVLADAQRLTAMACGAVLAFPTLQAVLARLRWPRAAPPEAGRPARLDTLSVHALPTPMLAAGLVLSLALLLGASLNPFLYFRF